MIYLLTNVAKTQNVPLDGTIFFGCSELKFYFQFFILFGRVGTRP